MELTDKARITFSADRFATELTGIVIDHVGDHESRCSLTLQDCHRNARGAVMGGVLFTLADFAAAVAANNSDLRWVSLDSTIHFLAPATGSSLTVHCTPLKLGRTTALFQSIIESPNNGKRIAIVETTMIQS